MQSPASSLFLLVLCERQPAKTENVRTDARDGTCGIRDGPAESAAIDRSVAGSFVPRQLTVYDR